MTQTVRGTSLLRRYGPTLATFFDPRYDGEQVFIDAVNHPRLWLRANAVATEERCALCGQVFNVSGGVELFKRGTWQPVCSECGGKESPALMRVHASLHALWLREYLLTMALVNRGGDNKPQNNAPEVITSTVHVSTCIDASHTESLDVLQVRSDADTFILSWKGASMAFLRSEFLAAIGEKTSEASWVQLVE